MVSLAATADNIGNPFAKEVPVSVVCRLTAVAALLLHLIFGCSLHHAAANGQHDHMECEHSCSAADSLSVQQQPAANPGHDHDQNRGTQIETPGVDTFILGRSMATCCRYESKPLDGQHSRCHGELECSFVPSSDVEFIIDRAFVAFVTYELDPMAGDASSLALRGLRERSAIGARDSLSHCASLCTWIV